MGNRTVRNVQTERAGKQIPKAVQSPKRRGASGPVFESFLTVTFRKNGSERENVNEIALFAHPWGPSTGSEPEAM